MLLRLLRRRQLQRREALVQRNVEGLVAPLEDFLGHGLIPGLQGDRPDPAELR